MAKMQTQLPDEEQIIKLYKFKFAGIEQPVTIEAYNNTQARALLVDALKLMPTDYGLSKVVDESVTIPVIGVSFIHINGKKNVWVGKDVSETGWMDQSEYLEKHANRNNSLNTK